MNDAATNRLLAALPASDRDALLRRMEPADVAAGQVVYQPGRAMSHAWFPLDCIISLQQPAESGLEAEVSHIGREGFVGVPLFMGGRLATAEAAALTRGTCLRVSAQVLRQLIRRSLAMERLFLRYAQALYFQSAQTALCRHIHRPYERTCSCLLSSSDRLVSAAPSLTMELLSQLLHIERGELGGILRELQESKAIYCRGGMISILDRPWLFRHACECYALTEEEYHHLVPRRQPIGFPSRRTRERTHESA